MVPWGRRPDQNSRKPTSATSARGQLRKLDVREIRASIASSDHQGEIGRRSSSAARESYERRAGRGKPLKQIIRPAKNQSDARRFSAEFALLHRSD